MLLIYIQGQTCVPFLSAHSLMNCAN